MALLGRCNRLDDDRLFQHYIEDSLYKGVALSIASSCLFAGLYYHATLLIPLDGEDIFGWRMLLTLLKSVINASQVTDTLICPFILLARRPAISSDIAWREWFNASPIRICAMS